jgi:peptide/nickel transport system substrate-binding protein
MSKHATRRRRTVNYAVDKVAYRDAVAGSFAPAGELASTVLAPTSLGYHRYDLYPTPGGRGDLAKARALLAAAGYPHGLTLRFATFGSGRYAAATKPIRDSLARAGIRLKVITYEGNDLWYRSLGCPPNAGSTSSARPPGASTTWGTTPGGRSCPSSTAASSGPTSAPTSASTTTRP